MAYHGVVDLPKDLELPLATGRPWWYWLGKRPALDFVNTLRERWWRAVETLVTPEDLGAWLVAAGCVEHPPAVSPALLREARVLREAMNDAVVAVMAGSPPPTAALRIIDSWLPRAAPVLRLAAGPDGMPALGTHPPVDAARAALAGLALDAAQLLGDPAQRARLRVCASPTCSARFYDRSPAAGRRWCSMQGCGNAAKARRHRARSRS
jgi:predicted RNA-binding Zn ribbon-like protein